MFKQVNNQKVNRKSPSYTKVFANTFIKHAENDTKIVAITGAMPSGTGLRLIRKNSLKECSMWVLQSNMVLPLLLD